MSGSLVSLLVTGLTLVIIEVLRSLPAWLHVRRSGSTDGVSTISTGVLAGTGPGWIAVAVLAPSPPAAVATGVWLCFHLLLWREIARLRPDLTRRIMIVAGSSFLASLAALLVGLFLGTALDTLGIFIAVSTLAYSLPALWEGMRSTSTAGLSLLALAVNTVEAAIYFVGGIGGGGIVPAGQVVPGYIFFGAIAALSNFPRLLRVALRRVRKLDGG